MRASKKRNPLRPIVKKVRQKKKKKMGQANELN